MSRRALQGGGDESGGSERAEPPRRLTLVAAFAAVYLIWGSTYLAIRFAIESGEHRTVCR